MNVSKSARVTRRHQVAETTATIGHTTDTLASQIHPSSAANDDVPAVAAERMVNPLWMITVALGVFFGAALLLLASV
jgi:hypothetical protein